MTHSTETERGIVECFAKAGIRERSARLVMARVANETNRTDELTTVRVVLFFNTLSLGRLEIKVVRLIEVVAARRLRLVSLKCRVRVENGTVVGSTWPWRCHLASYSHQPSLTRMRYMAGMWTGTALVYDACPTELAQYFRELR